MQVFEAGTCIKRNCALKTLKGTEHYTHTSGNTRFMPLMKKSHAV